MRRWRVGLKRAYLRLLVRTDVRHNRKAAKSTMRAERYVLTDLNNTELGSAGIDRRSCLILANFFLQLF